MCCRVDRRAPGSHLATFRPISFPRLMTERGPGSSLILSTSGRSTESVSTNKPIYQRLLTNCRRPTLLPLLLHITVGCLVREANGWNQEVSCSMLDIWGLVCLICTWTCTYCFLYIFFFCLSLNLNDNTVTQWGGVQCWEYIAPGFALGVKLISRLQGGR